MRLIDADALRHKIFVQYCMDCDRRKGIKNGEWRVIYEVGEAPCRACGVGDVKDEIEDAPTIEERKTGKWILVTDNRGQHFECDHCGEWRYHQKQKFCGECGADMRGEGEAE